MEYALNNKRSGRERYIYVVNYRNNQGFDILETGKSRGMNLNSFFHPNRKSSLQKHEVNVKGQIENSDVLGAWKVHPTGELEWINNPEFIENKLDLPRYSRHL